jgi:hypothetical protein
MKEPNEVGKEAREHEKSAGIQKRRSLKREGSEKERWE